MISEQRFSCAGQTIRGKLFRASEAGGPTLLLLPGFPGNEDDVLDLGEALAKTGINTLTFNYRGTYQSEGEYGLENTLADIQAAHDHIRTESFVVQNEIDITKLVLGGYSYGGGMGLIYAAQHPEIKHLISIAGTDHGEFAREYLRNQTFSTAIDTAFEQLKHPDGPVKFTGKNVIKEQLISYADRYDVVLHTEQLTERSILLIGGIDDPNVVIEHHVIPIYRALKKNGAERVSLVTIQDNHEFENSRAQLAAIISTWINSL